MLYLIFPLFGIALSILAFLSFGKQSATLERPVRSAKLYRIAMFCLALAIGLSVVYFIQHRHEF